MSDGQLAAALTAAILDDVAVRVEPDGAGGGRVAAERRERDGTVHRAFERFADVDLVAGAVEAAVEKVAEAAAGGFDG